MFLGLPILFENNIIFCSLLLPKDKMQNGFQETWLHYQLCGYLLLHRLKSSITHSTCLSPLLRPVKKFCAFKILPF